ncbi:MAG: DNA repair protein RecN [Deltaproteobacteria bacterium]|nr:DNA repair protein RecN [Deltaproteobacteria bacterium]
MLKRLDIKGFALIDELSLPFGAGLTVLTGETGAGKSIIVDALQAVLGEKTDTAVIRSGENSAIIDGVFRVPEAMYDLVEPGSDGELSVHREIPVEGRSRAFVNGSSMPLSRLRTLGDGLVDLHGQHEHQTLLKVAAHLQALDAFAGLEEKRAQHEETFRRKAEISRKIRHIEEKGRENLARTDYLNFVVHELEAASIDADEEDALRGEEKVLASAGKLQSAAANVLEAVYQSDGSLADGVGGAASSLRGLLNVDARLGEIVDLLDNSRAQIEEAAHLLRKYAGMVQADPQRLDMISGRLALIEDMKRKYGPTVKDVLAFYHGAIRELDEMETGQESEDALRAEENRLGEILVKSARDLSAGRRAAASRLEKRVLAELADLAMERIRFKVDFEDVPHFEKGTDLVEFLISTNPGEPLMPLRKIASGGELSRVMLALKTILAHTDGVPTLVFDEVDSGIGGRTSGILGRKLKEISGHHQVLCITHLAPVAACADRHIMVEKVEHGGRAVIRARFLDGDERVGELARMIGGMELTAAIVSSAREMLEEFNG